MSSIPVLTNPNSLLRIVSKEMDMLEIQSKETEQLVSDLIETMIVENGIGIAAPQVGIHKRLVVIDLGNGSPQAFFNPVITSKSFAKTESEEGCLSVPGIFGIVKRHRSVTVTAHTIRGEEKTFRVHGLPAIVFQHEVDHLDGILFIDKAIRYTSPQKL